MRLSPDTVSRLPSDILRPQYERATQQPGIVHFGIGAFHRAHQAVMTDDAMNAGDRDWSIIGVSLRSAKVAADLVPQHGLYLAIARSDEGAQGRLIGSVQKVLVAPENPDAVIQSVALPSIRILSFTITEKGYCRKPDGSLDPKLADESSVFRYLRDGLGLRRKLGLEGVTLLCCDNLAGNGEKMSRLLREYLLLHDAGLWEWVRKHCTFPSTMVDRIVPATSEPDKRKLAQKIGMRDEACIFTESFNQWIIEDKFAGARPQWEAGGAEIVHDVLPYETAKLRMLNGAHSAIAYIGLSKGYKYVHDAVSDPDIRAMAGHLMREEAAPTIDSAGGQDLYAYADALIERFDNSALQHRLMQIAMDGSQKIPQRWLETLAWHAEGETQCPSILRALACWMKHIRGDNGPVDDPMAKVFAGIWENADIAHVADRLFGAAGVYSDYWIASDNDIAEIVNLFDA